MIHMNCKEASKITGMPERRIQFYTEMGVVVLENPHPGRGRERQYSDRNILELLIIGEMAKHGIEVSKVERAMKEIPRKLNLDSCFKPEIYEEKNPPGRYITVYEDGGIHYGGVRDKVTLGTSEKFEINMKGHSSALVINVTELAKRLP